MVVSRGPALIPGSLPRRRHAGGDDDLAMPPRRCGQNALQVAGRLVAQRRPRCSQRGLVRSEFPPSRPCRRRPPPVPARSSHARNHHPRVRGSSPGTATSTPADVNTVGLSRYAASLDKLETCGVSYAPTRWCRFHCRLVSTTANRGEFEVNREVNARDVVNRVGSAAVDIPVFGTRTSGVLFYLAGRFRGATMRAGDTYWDSC